MRKLRVRSHVRATQALARLRRAQGYDALHYRASVVGRHLDAALVEIAELRNEHAALRAQVAAFQKGRQAFSLAVRKAVDALLRGNG